MTAGMSCYKARMAIAIARGGIGIIHKNMSIEECFRVDKVKVITDNTDPFFYHLIR